MTVIVSTPPATSPPDKYGGDPIAFDAAMQAHLTWQTSMVSELNSQNAENNSINSNVNTQTAAAANAAAAAVVSANLAASAASSQIWISGVTYPVGYVAYSPITYRTYRRTVLGAGTTDPSLDPTNWALLTLEIDTGHPALLPSLNLDFATSQVIDPRITFTRATSATRTNSKGLIETVLSGVPRIDYDPVTLECKGLLVEAARTNLLAYSEQFDNAAWSKSVATITANQLTAPDGTLTADLMTVTAAGGAVYETVTVTAATTYVGSVYAAAGTIALSSLRFAFYDATALAFISSDVTPTQGETVNGMTRYYLAVTTPAGCVSMRFYPMRNSAVTSGTLYLWGAQLEAGAFPTSYIPTVAAAVTRNADVASMTGLNFSSWFNALEGSVLLAHIAGGDAITQELVTISDGTAAEQMGMRYSSSSQAQYVVADGGAQTVSIAPTGYSTIGSTYKRAVSYKLNDFAQSIDGVAATVDTSSTVPTVTKINIGSSAVGSNVMTGHIKSLRYYPKALTAAQLQALSTQ